MEITETVKILMLPAALICFVYGLFIEKMPVSQLLVFGGGLLALFVIGFILIMAIEKLMNPSFDALKLGADDLIISAISNYEGKGEVIANGITRGKLIGLTLGKKGDIEKEEGEATKKKKVTKKGVVLKRAIVIGLTGGWLPFGSLYGHIFGKLLPILVHPDLMDVQFGNVYIHSTLQRYGHWWGCSIDPKWTPKEIAEVEEGFFTLHALRAKFTNLGAAFTQHEKTNALFLEKKAYMEKGETAKDK